MKEMVYSAERKNEILDTGFCFGLLYYILNLGTHPTAYIKIPKNHRLYGKSESEIYEEVDIDVHGGITYAQEGIYVDNNQDEEWIVLPANDDEIFEIIIKYAKIKYGEEI